jgi:hypothetical protein
LRTPFTVVLGICCVGAGAASLVGACYQPLDEVPNFPWLTVHHASSTTTGGGMGGAGGGTGMGGAGGSGATGPDCTPGSSLSNEEFFIECVLDDKQNSYNTPNGGLVNTCAGGSCHSAGGYQFLGNKLDDTKTDGANAYETITGWISPTSGKSFIVPDPTKVSRFISWPQSVAHAGGAKWQPTKCQPVAKTDFDPGLCGLYRNVVTWIEREAACADDLGNPGCASGNHVVVDTTTQSNAVDTNGANFGYVYVPLAPIADQTGDKRIAGAAVSFFAINHNDSLLEILDLKVYPAPGTGLTIKNMGFKVAPVKIDPVTKKPDPAGEPDLSKAKIDQSLFGDAVTFVSPDNVDFGSGQAVIQWSKGATMYLIFAGDAKAKTPGIVSLIADSHGNTFTPCQNVGTFQGVVAALPYKLDQFGNPPKTNGANGLLYCAHACHGGTEFIPPNPTNFTKKMDLSNLFAKVVDYELDCAVARSKSTPGNLGQSAIFTRTDPANNMDMHVYKFGGNPDAWNTFKTVVGPWVCAEAGGATVCPSDPMSAKPKYCADLKVAANDCGKCENVCPMGDTCGQGVCCGAIQGQRVCGTYPNATCVDTTTDNANCGKCGNKCISPKTCKANAMGVGSCM